MIAIIVNPQAGRRDKSRLVREMQKRAQVLQIDYTLAYSDAPKKIVSLVAMAAKQCERLVIAGGDGSIQEAIEGLNQVNWPCPLAIIPCGSGNDLAKSLNLPTDLESAIDLAFTGTPAPLTLGTVNGHPFANIVSTGVDADIVALRTKLKPYLSGPLAYLAATIMTIVHYKPKHFELLVDGKSIEGKYALIAVANGKYYGGGMKIAPNADPTHPEFNLVAVKGLRPLKLLSLLYLVYSGRHVKTPYVEEYYGMQIEIRSKGKVMAINYDGELMAADELVAKRVLNADCKVIVRPRASL